MDRRSFFTTGLAFLAAPAILRVAPIMPVKAQPAPRFMTGFVQHIDFLEAIDDPTVGRTELGDIIRIGEQLYRVINTCMTPASFRIDLKQT